MVNRITGTTLLQDIVFYLLNQSKKSQERGSYRTANEYSNCALALTVTAIVSGLMGFILGVGIFFAYFFHPCTLGVNFSKFVTYTLAACMLQHKLFEYSFFPSAICNT